MRLQLNSERGFTLVELLVVLMVIGVLASLALPAFLSQRAKAQDSCAKAQVTAAYKAAIIYRQRSGSNVGMTLAQLRIEDRSISTTATGGCSGSSSFAIANGGATSAGCSGTIAANTLCVRIISSSTVRYNLVVAANQSVTRNCFVPTGVRRGGCPASNRW